MKKLWVGYLLMMLSTNIILCISPFENSQLVIFPPFIGYIVMAAAYHKLKKEDPVFGRNAAGVTAMAILMILRFVSDGLGLTAQIPHAYAFVLGVKLIEIGALIYFTKIPADLFARWEEEEEGEYHTRRLTVAWQNVAITQAASILGYFIRSFAMLLPLVCVITTILYLKDLRDVMNARQTQLEEKSEA